MSEREREKMREEERYGKNKREKMIRHQQQATWKTNKIQSEQI